MFAPEDLYLAKGSHQKFNTFDSRGTIYLFDSLKILVLLTYFYVSVYVLY